MIDTHCHIDQFKNPYQVLSYLEKSNIYTISVTNLPSHFAEGYKYYKRYKYIRPAIGFHPMMFGKKGVNLDSELILFLQYVNKTSYIGEIGLDYSSNFERYKEEQVDLFDRITSIAANMNKLVSVHSRKAESDVINILKKNDVKNAILHWYTGPMNVLRDAITAGYYFSINERMLRSSNGRQVITKIPLERVLTETDSPFANSNDSDYSSNSIQTVFNYLSQIWNMSELNTKKRIKQNLFALINGIGQQKTST